MASTTHGRFGAAAVLEGFTGFSGGRLRCLLHFTGLAVTLAAAKVILNTAGVALFLAEQGAEQLPLFYIGLAVVAITLSSVFAGIVDRMPRIRLAQATLPAALIGAAALRVAIAAELPGAYHGLLASVHLYEILVEIVFWVVLAAYLDTIELKRGAPLIFMAFALGGVGGGALAAVLAASVPADDLLLVLPILGVTAAAQLEIAGRRLEELRERGGRDAEPAGVMLTIRRLPHHIARYPLVLLIALNALLLTILYGLSEYLVFTVYATEFPDEAALTRFLAIIYALIQVLELALLYAISRPLLRRAGPLLRNLVFPLTSLACLLTLAFGHRLPAAILTHLNAEAASNAVFQPVNNTNYVALPLRYHGRVRTLADGIFYPGGLALAGIMLLIVPAELALIQVTFLAITFGLIFVAVNIGVGTIFLPTLMRTLRSGVAELSVLAPPGKGPPAAILGRIKEAIRGSSDPGRRTAGTRSVVPGRVITPADVPGLLPGADRSLRRALLGTLAGAPAAGVGTVLERLLDSPDDSFQLLGLQAKLARNETLDPPRAERLAGSPHPAIATLAVITGRPTGATDLVMDDIARVARDADGCTDLITALEMADRPDLLWLLLALVERAPPEQQRQGLAVLGQIAKPGDARALQLVRRLARSPEPALRADAVAALSALAAGEQTLEEVAAALEDASRRVRQRAALCLASHGDTALHPVLARLRRARPEVVEAAVLALGRIGSRRARDALIDLLQPIYLQAERNLEWLRRLPADRNRAAWAPFEAALDDQNHRIVATVMQVLGGLGEDRLVASLRRALATVDQRTRANALEALVSLPHRRFLLPVLPLLEAMLLPGERGRAGDRRPPSSGANEALLGAAMGSSDRWLRVGAGCTATALGLALGAPPAADAPGSVTAARAPPPTELDMEQVLFLKRVPLFRYLPLDSLLAVTRSLERQCYVRGETICAAGAPADHFCIIESGAVEIIEASGRVERLTEAGYFGELALLEAAARSPLVLATEDCVVLRLHRLLFEDLSWDHPEIVMELCKLIARRLRQVQSLLAGPEGQLRRSGASDA